MKNFPINKTVLAVALAASMSLGSTSAMAVPINLVTIDEGSIPNAAPNIIENVVRFSGPYTEVATFNSDGTFSTSIKWQAASILRADGKILKDQLGGFPQNTGSNTYDLYALFTATGTFITKTDTEGKQLATNFTFGTNGDLALYVDVQQDTDLVTLPTSGDQAWARNGNTADDKLLATGTTVSGAGVLDPNLTTCLQGNNCGSFGVNTTFELTSDGSRYFTAPKPFFNLAFNSGQLISFAPTGTQTISGSLDLQFANANSIPEPATVALLGFGLLGVSMAGRKRKQA